MIGKGIELADDNKKLVEVDADIRYHDVEIIGEELRAAMQNMKSL